MSTETATKENTGAASNAASKTRTHTIDAAGKRLGKVATEAATVLMGKDQTDFAKHTMADVQVTITNASQLDIPYKKRGEIYQRYSGYPSGRTTERLVDLAARLGYSEVVRQTVKGMLPKNKLQAQLMKNLEVTE